MEMRRDSPYDWGRLPVRTIERRGQAVTLRPLNREDERALGDYFLGLSTATKNVYGPHAFDRPTAASICAGLETPDGNVHLRLVAVAAGAVVGYFILYLGLRESDRKRRYADLNADQACTLAPSVADAWQNGGLGAEMMEYTKACARVFGKTVMVLWNGVQHENAQGVHFYFKTGFRKVGDFPSLVTRRGVPVTIINDDMMVDL